MLRFKNFNIQSVEAPTSGACNHKSNQKKKLASSEYNINVYVHKKLDVNQAYFRKYNGKTNSNQNYQKC